MVQKINPCLKSQVFDSLLKFSATRAGLLVTLLLTLTPSSFAQTNNIESDQQLENSFDEYFPKANYPEFQPLQNLESSRLQNSWTGSIKALSTEIKKSVTEVAQKRNMTCHGDPCLLQFFPLAYTRRDSGFFGGLRLNLTNISVRNPYYYSANIQVIRSDTKQLINIFTFDVPRMNLKIIKPRLKFRTNYSRSTEMRYTGKGSESKNFRHLSDEAKRYSHKQKGAGSTLLFPLKQNENLNFGFYTTYDYVNITNDPYRSENSLLFSKKPESYEGGVLHKLGAGIYSDTRNSEIFTRSGQFFEMGHSLGFRDKGHLIHRINLIDRRYFTEGRWTLAHRFTWDAQWGKVPFWELAATGGIDPISDISGSGILKGFRVGRFHEYHKLIESFEIRVQQNDFRMFGLKGSLVIIPIALDMALMGSQPAWSASVGFDALWNSSFLTRFAVAYAESEFNYLLRFNQEF